MTEVIIGSKIGNDVKILDFQKIWEDRMHDEVKESLESKGCKMLEIGWSYDFSEETLERINEAIELSERYDIYDITSAPFDVTIRDYIAVPRDYTVVLAEWMYGVSLKHLTSMKEQAKEHLKANDIGKVIKQGEFSNEDGEKGMFSLNENGFNSVCGDDWYRRATLDRINYFALHEDGALCINANFIDDMRYYVDSPEEWIEAFKKIFNAKGKKLTKMGYIVVE